MTKVDSHLCHLQSEFPIELWMSASLSKVWLKDVEGMNQWSTPHTTPVSHVSHVILPKLPPSQRLMCDWQRIAFERVRRSLKRLTAVLLHGTPGGILGASQNSCLQCRGLLCSISTACWYSKSLIRQTTWSMFIQFWFEPILAQALQVL